MIKRNNGMAFVAVAILTGCTGSGGVGEGLQGIAQPPPGDVPTMDDPSPVAGSSGGPALPAPPPEAPPPAAVPSSMASDPDAAPSTGPDVAQGPDAMEQPEPPTSEDPMTPSEPMASGPLEPIIPEVTGTCPEFTSGTKTVDGLGGIVFTVGPKSEEGKGSLVFYWHGTGSTAGESRMIPTAAQNEITGAGGMIVSFGRSKGTGGDCSGTGTFSIDDMEVADLIVACAVKNHNIDPHRIYATGCSAGGLMSGCMGIRRSSYMAAVVPNSGGVTIGYGEIQDPSRVPAVMTMHGGAADWVIVSFPQTSEAYDNYMTKAGSFVINCDHGGGHCGAPAALQQSAWEFMKAHPFGTKPSPFADGLPSDFHNSCKIWEPTERQPIGEG